MWAIRIFPHRLFDESSVEFSERAAVVYVSSDSVNFTAVPGTKQPLPMRMESLVFSTPNEIANARPVSILAIPKRHAPRGNLVLVGEEQRDARLFIWRECANGRRRE
jgi:hypothetical protein